MGLGKHDSGGGWNGKGQLGINSTISSYSSFQTVPSITNIKQIACGYGHSFGLKTDGSLVACGTNTYGQLGLNLPGTDYSSFQTVPSITNIKQMAGGFYHSLGLKTDGTLISCGYNRMGQLGINSTTSSYYSSFKAIPAITNVKQIAAGSYHSLGLKIDGTLISCGDNTYGQLGLGSSVTDYSSFQTIPSITNIKQIACGSNHSLGLKTDGTLISCGRNYYGQLGCNLPWTNNYNTFQTIPSITNVKQIACGDNHSFGLKTDGTLVSCGRNGDSQLGRNAGTDQSSFQTVPSVTNVKQIACGSNRYSFGLKTDGTLISCGYNGYYGSLGLNTTAGATSFQTVPSITNIKQISAGYAHTGLLQY